jgi:nucleotide-binding universal stress UspA family protein
MSSIAQATPESLNAVQPTRQPDGPIIVATDLTPSSDAAFAVAASLGARAKSEVVALSVIEPMNVPVYGVDGTVVTLDAFAESEPTRSDAIRAQLTRVTGSATWPIVLRTGERTREISAAARELRARLIVVGRGRHPAGIDRVFGGEAVLGIVKHGDSPVLAVEEGLTSPPRRVVIATDFSPFSLYAAQVAMTIIAPDAQVWLVHVGPVFDESVPFLRDRAKVYGSETDAAVLAFRAALPSGRMKIESALLSGRVADEVLSFSADHHADLIVTASHGYGFLRRVLLGSVGTNLVRHAPCSVLIVPGSARTVAEARAKTAPNLESRSLASAVLDGELAAFSRRNLGRLCHVEIDDAALGAQVLGHDMPLAGATFDQHRKEIALMFGTSTLRGLHLTHTIAGVTEVDVRGVAGGDDQVLRVAHERGQTLVSMT